MFSKLFRKLTTRVKYTRFWNAKLKSIRLVFHRIEIEPFRLDFDTHNKNKNNEREALPKRKEKQSNNLLLKQSNTTHFQKHFFSNNQTQQPKRNNNINKPKTHLGFCMDRIAQVLLELLGSDQCCWSWLDGISGSLSLCLVPYLSFPTEAQLGFARIGLDLGFVGVEFCLSLLKGRTEQQNWVQ